MTFSKHDIDLNSIVVEKNVPIKAFASNKIIAFVRNMESGDSFTVTGYQCRKHLITLFGQAKIPFITRLMQRPVAEDNSTYVYRIWVYHNHEDKIAAKRGLT